MIFHPTEAHLHQAVKHLNLGELVGLPTETVYGLAADARNDEAVAKVYALKERPKVNPLIVHLAEWEDAEDYAFPTPLFYQLIQAFPSGPLTIVLPKRPDAILADAVTAGLDTVALRVPFHPVAHALLRQFNGPLAAPSANLSGKLSPTCALHVANDFQDDNLFILDGGEARVGIESTIIDLSREKPTILRAGIVTQQVLAGLLDQPVEEQLIAKKGDVRSPGQLLRHYAPDVPVRLNATEAKAGEIFVGFGKQRNADYNLSPAGDLSEAAARLFALLHELNLKGQPIAFAKIPETGIGKAINDRLRRAVSPSEIREK